MRNRKLIEETEAPHAVGHGHEGRGRGCWRSECSSLPRVETMKRASFFNELADSRVVHPRPLRHWDTQRPALPIRRADVGRLVRLVGHCTQGARSYQYFQAAPMKAIPAIGKQVPVRGWNPRHANSSCCTVGCHAHQTFEGV